MKVIVTGATGNLGRFVVQHCLDHADITSIVILTRKAVAGHVESHPKVQVVMHQDFSRYPDDLMRSLQGAQACLWAIGHMHVASSDGDSFHHVTVGLCVAAAQRLCHSLADKTPNGAKFRFVFCSSRHADHGSSRITFLLMDELHRSAAAEAERRVCQVADSSMGRFEAYMLRPLRLDRAAANSYPLSCAAPSSFVRRPVEALRPLFASQSRPYTPVIDPSRVARAMVMIACRGWKDRFINNDALLDELKFEP